MEYIEAKQILVPTQDHLWFGSDYTMNLYKGCCHGCIYCDSRSRCYGVTEFDRVRAKKDALVLLEKELRGKRKKGIVASGSMTDPYNPFEEELRLTRGSLELLNENGYGVSVTTKSTLLTRDIDLFQKIRAHSPVICGITITAGDDELGKKIEPHAPSSTERFEAIKRLSAEGVYCGILLTPILPFITDTEENILYIIHKAKEAGAKFIYPTLEYFYDRLDELFPGMRQQYIKEYGENYYCGTKKSIELYASLKKECKKLGLLYRMQDLVEECEEQYKFEQISFLDHIDLNL